MPVKDVTITHVFARDLTEADIEQLRTIAETTPRRIPYECFWGTKRFLVEELQRFLWFYDSRPDQRGHMACEYIETAG